MEVDSALRTVEALVAGCDPATGEQLEEGHVLRRSEIREALQLITEALHVVRSAVITPQATLSVSSAEPIQPSPYSAYEAARRTLGVDASGGPARFRKPGWFYIGQAVTSCPECSSTMEAFRAPYSTRAGLRFHYWALLCPHCKLFVEPRDLGPMRKALYDSSTLRPSDEISE